MIRARPTQRRRALTPTQADQDVLFEQRAALGIATLNRPKALNALTLGMIRALQHQLEAWQDDPAISAVLVQGAGDRAFCAGGDIRAIAASGLAPAPLKRDFFHDEYRLNYLVHTYRKPYVALLDGIAMGGGVGLSAHGRFRVTTERTLLAMPETGIGLFPDVGATWVLNRCPGRLGLYLGLTGHRASPAEVHMAGIGTHHVPSHALPGLIDALAAAAPLEPAVIEAALAGIAVTPGRAALDEHRAEIDRIFGAGSVAAIRAALGAASAAWAATAARALDRASPTSLAVAFSQLSRGAGLDIAAVFRMEFRMSQHFLAAPDFYEGVRAVLIDKDNAPRWSPATLAEIDPATVEGYFGPVAGGELALP